MAGNGLWRDHVRRKGAYVLRMGERGMNKIFFVLILVVFVSGFRVALYDRFWDITKTDPYVWIRFCEDVPEFKDFDVNAGDELEDRDVDFITAISSVLDDYNSIETSYLKLELHPETPGSEGLTPHFDETKAETRTVNVCWGPPNGTHKSHSKETSKNNKLEGCKVVLGKEAKTDLHYFVSVLTHELGHCMGLAHPQDTRKSIMSYHRNKLMRLQLDDKMGITHLYPTESAYGREEPTLGLSCAPR